MEAYNLSVEQLGKQVIRIRGIVDCRFYQRDYIGYTEKQAKDKFKETLSKGETKV